MLGSRLRKKQARRSPTADLDEMLTEDRVERARNHLLLVVQESLSDRRAEPSVPTS